MDAIIPMRKDLDLTLADVLERRRQHSYGSTAGIGFGGELALLGFLFLFFVFLAWLVRQLSVEPTTRGLECAIEQTPAGIDLIDENGQRESVPREALGLQVASLWEPRRLLILKTWVRGPGRLGRTVAVGTVDWVPIKSDSTVREWEEFLGVKVNPQVTMNVS